jgi:type I restriction enzyme R subunit
MPPSGKAFDQIQTYKDQIPSLFAYNEVLIVSDGVEAQVGSLKATKEWFMPWRTIEGEELAPTSLPQLQVVLRGLLEQRRLLDSLRYFIAFENDGAGNLKKKIAGWVGRTALLAADDDAVCAAYLRKDGVIENVRTGAADASSRT